MYRTLFAGIIVLCGLCLTGGLTISEWQVARTQHILPAVLLVGKETPAQVDHLSHLRKILLSVDPETRQYPKTWAALNRLTRQSDQHGNLSTDPELVMSRHLATVDLFQFAAQEEVDTLTVQITASHFYTQLSSLVTLGIGVLFLTFIFYSERSIAKRLATLGTKGPRYSGQPDIRSHFDVSLSQQSKRVEDSFQELQFSVKQLQEQNLALVLAQRQRSQSGPDQSPVVTQPLGAQVPDEFELQSAVGEFPSQTIPLASPRSTLSLVDVTPNTGEFQPAPEKIESPQLQTLKDIPLAPQGLNTYGGLLDLPYSDVVAIEIEELELLHHLYGHRVQVVIDLILNHLAESLQRHNVASQELAITGTTLYWALLEPTELSAIERFICDCYEQTPIILEGNQINPPLLSVFFVESSQSSYRLVQFG